MFRQAWSDMSINWLPIETLTHSKTMNGRDVLVCVASADAAWRDVLMAQVHNGQAYTWHKTHGPLTHWAVLNMPGE